MISGTIWGKISFGLGSRRKETKMGSYMQMLTNRAKAAASEAAKLGTSDKNRGLLAVAEELAAH